MYNIAYYEKYITKLDCKAYKVYKEICSLLHLKEIIFCDACDLILDKNIPVFHSYHLRQLYNLTFIITDKYSLDSLDKIVNARIVVVYDHITDSSIPSRDNILLYNINDDIRSFLTENIYEISKSE